MGDLRDLLFENGDRLLQCRMHGIHFLQQAAFQFILDSRNQVTDLIINTVQRFISGAF